MKPSLQNLYVSSHPLIHHKLTLMRRKETSPSLFRQLMIDISLLMTYEVMQEAPTSNTPIQTLSGSIQGIEILEEKFAIVPILRAGLGMAEGLSKLLPNAPLGHIGLFRDSETKQAVKYFSKLPSAPGKTFILVDPMLATGHSAVKAIDVLNEHGVEDKHILFMALISAPEGIEIVSHSHPEVKIYTAALDEKLDTNAYIIPGLGDAGDRLYGTQ